MTPTDYPDQWAIEKLSPRHDRLVFDCGSDPLNEFLKKYAGQNQKSGISQTYVAIRPGSSNVEGYYTISSGSMQFAHVPADLAHGLPRYPIPVAHVGRLAVTQIAQGRGLGRLLLLDAMDRTVRAADSIGIHALDVLAKNEQAKTFYLKYGLVPLLDDPRHLYISIKTLRQFHLV